MLLYHNVVRGLNRSYFFPLLLVVVKPDYYKYVFVKAERPVTGVSISEPGGIEEEVIDLDTNDQQLVPFKSVQNLLTSGSVYLI